MKHECSFEDRMQQEHVKRLCCLYALGELSPEEHLRVEAHLKNCIGCRTRTDEFERIMLYDLPAVSIARMAENIPEQAALLDHEELLAGILEKANAIKLRRTEEWESSRVSNLKSAEMQQSRWSLSIAHLHYAAGCAAAVILLLGYLAFCWKTKNSIHQIAQTAPVVSSFAAGTVKSPKPEGKESDLRLALARAEQRVHDARAADAQLNEQIQGLGAENDSLRAQLGAERTRASEISAELELSRQSLSEQIAAKDSLQSQLSDLNERMQKRNSEIAALSRAASVMPVNFPVAEQTVGGTEAKEILGARDLHIVDVYDVDGSGKSSRAYGRIYYVNHDQLIFYAFDLSKLERDHKVVAFQAWGYLQPQSTEVESLGLFYLDNARLNRWTLRVSDPQILSRIDTLFVTAEPPGGSRFPKGKRLLMASLAGPPNHP